MKLKNLFAVLILSVLIAACSNSSDDNPPPTPSSKEGVVADKISDLFNLDSTKSDTDGDGLTDVFELTYGYPDLKPDLVDSDDNGINDSQEDNDNDSVLNVDEEKNGTHPLKSDTDNDQLSDSEELTYKTDPLKEDTDGDGMLDGREILNGTDPLVADADSVITSKDIKTTTNIETGVVESVSIEVLGESDLASKVVVSNSSDSPIQGQVGRRFDISLPEEDLEKMQSVEITLPFDPSHENAADPEQLAVYTIDPSTGFWEALPSTVDTVNSTVTGTSTHFSPFVLSNKTIFNDYISKIPETCLPIDDPNTLPADVMLVIDSSGSMRDNDPSNIRISAAKSFATAMKDTDRVGVVDFDSYSRLALGLSNDITAINNALDTIDSSGSTNIGAGVGTAISELNAQAVAGSIKAIILLTDGQGSYDTSLTQTMVDNKIRVFSIGLTGAVDEALLSGISSATNGGYKKIDDAADLVGVFKDFSTVFGDDGSDDDADGLTNCQEIQGVYLLNNSSIARTDPSKEDTDGDGILDGAEIGLLQEATLDGFSIWFSDAYSDPTKEDTDEDGMLDPDEYRASTNTFAEDSDADGVSDYFEIEELGTDPTNADTDGDTLTDGDEYNQRDDGFDPTVFNYKVDWKTKALFMGEFLKGGVFGDAVNIDTPPELYGQLVGGFFAVNDVFGFFGNLWKGEYLDAGASAFAAVPYFGDAAGAGKRVSNFLEKNPHLRYEAVSVVGKHFDDAGWVAKYLPALPAKAGSWAKKPFVRGKELEVKIAADLPGDALLGNFPKIDVWDASTGKVTSIKTLDLDAKSYQRASAFKSRVKKYADDLNDFAGTGPNGWAGTTIPKAGISSRDLVIGIPRKQSDELSDIVEELAREKGVNIILKIVE